MKHVKEFGVILAVSFCGEILHLLLPLPVPASIYGLVLMLICLFTKIIKVENVRTTGYFLIEIMPMMFIPAAVGLLETWPALHRMWLPFCIIVCFSTLAVMVIAGRVTQMVARLHNGEDA
ncbi:MAG: CidA/LrgA family protein [Victivallaceae bacterium]|nr:CidA/LrgA family protein [Victivallaceae bacterium]